jgi:hypothetical protein
MKIKKAAQKRRNLLEKRRSKRVYNKIRTKLKKSFCSCELIKNCRALEFG